MYHVSGFKSCLQAHSTVISTMKSVWPEVEVVFDDLIQVCHRAHCPACAVHCNTTSRLCNLPFSIEY